MKYYVTIRDETVEVRLDSDGVEIDGERVDVTLRRVPGSPVRALLLGSDPHHLVAQPLGRWSWLLHVGGRPVPVEVMDERTRAVREMASAARAGRGPSHVRAPMPGLVVRVEVTEGDVVAPGQGVVIVEAMKMENELTAEARARVAAVHVRAGDAVEKGQPLIDLDPLEAG